MCLGQEAGVAVEFPCGARGKGGGRGGNRTRTPLRGTDFKSVVYAYSTTRPWRNDSIRLTVFAIGARGEGKKLTAKLAKKREKRIGDRG